MEKNKDARSTKLDYRKCKEELLNILDQLKHETFLSDIKEENFNADYINLLYKYETGNAFKITIERGNLPSIEIIIKSNATLLDLKHQYEKELNNLYLNNCSSNKNKRKRNFINWSYVWKRYCFSFKGTRLTENKLNLKDIGFERNTTLQFKKYLFNKKH
ncbi:hypothetical protein BCR36DRAFT_580125 [Piromyces finnis]|uniref:SNRNP25 ubiquitin-like domain-containing protein n=1 Tax=Piromyces finnis TaxID=1754191 RepID=A0A1Y1VKA1_9FUNG|nr:hypothetical protein BCR36DRAFT_580125 [Piromyces finnis]|eukprot:ORX58512.1 hypothetical protein BCR36DRAFT_580125 [Piromyces finnis]